MRDGDEIAASLRRWYDANARVLPWRIPPAASERPDPYRVWLSEVMLQQTTVAAVRGYFRRFTERWPTVADLAGASDGEVMAEWAGLGYYARARNLLACARIVSGAQGGRFPETEAGLRALPGIGAYTAAAIAAIAFGRPATVVDGNVERVVARLFAVESALPKAKPVLSTLAATLTPVLRPGDHAQAMMDLGATICTPRNPACALCPLRGDCLGFAGGDPASYPRKAPKAAKPTRTGTLWIARRGDGALLVERRPDRGLLGGTLGFPGTEWDGTDTPPPMEAEWRAGPSVSHTFTHFHLDAGLLVADVGPDTVPSRGAFESVDPARLTTLMRKAHDTALPAFSFIERKDLPS